jgi:hypothetical protein
MKDECYCSKPTAILGGQPEGEATGRRERYSPRQRQARDRQAEAGRGCTGTCSENGIWLLAAHAPGPSSRVSSSRRLAFQHGLYRTRSCLEKIQYQRREASRQHRVEQTVAGQREAGPRYAGMRQETGMWKERAYSAKEPGRLINTNSCLKKWAVPSSVLPVCSRPPALYGPSQFCGS